MVNKMARNTKETKETVETNANATVATVATNAPNVTQYWTGRKAIDGKPNELPFAQEGLTFVGRNGELSMTIDASAIPRELLELPLPVSVTGKKDMIPVDETAEFTLAILLPMAGAGATERLYTWKPLKNRSTKVTELIPQFVKRCLNLWANGYATQQEYNAAQEDVPPFNWASFIVWIRDKDLGDNLNPKRDKLISNTTSALNTLTEADLRSIPWLWDQLELFGGYQPAPSKIKIELSDYL